MKELLKIISTLWDVVNPQKNLDDHWKRVIRVKISQKNKERLVIAMTWAKIFYGYWILLILTGAVVLAGIYIMKP